ncbi:FtsW/RodA/SpoVE family cell cycle protein [Enterococcus sp. ALS3]|uniref:Probable peptidoglycan glycosyltransferase FtsW n=1 Tax=Enterococcus alishanensis TaxID=1303817 RepID=A0ABS6TF08_9ENTE|nr:FtsW/RodA/SpoVE family cell cycle protein [Enterococcus alishanensis]MBV7391499.1 FtsW/RodA/SpoVE family cell cycle protein [Enterococcus alishanensis]
MIKNRKIDLVILVPYFILSVIGLLEIYSASSYRLMVTDEYSLSLLYRQFIFIIISLTIIGVTFFIKLEYLLHPLFIKGGLIVSFLLLIMVKVGFFAVTVNGAQRWISIGGLQFQPSEIIVIFLILYLASYFKNKNITNVKLTKPFIITGLATGLVLLQPKISGAFMIIVIVAVIIWAAAIPVEKGIMGIGLFLMGIILIASIVLILGENNLLPTFFSHAYNRISIVHNPFLDEHGYGYQMANSYYALYNGGFLGLGLGNSLTKQGYLPEAETDFIFSIISEELGLLGAIFVLFLIFVVCLRIFQKSIQCKDQQLSLVLIGFGTLILIQSSINVASVLGLIPMTGVPLPFVSYGGTSYLILSFALGICLNIISRKNLYLLKE